MLTLLLFVCHFGLVLFGDSTRIAMHVFVFPFSSYLLGFCHIFPNLSFPFTPRIFHKPFILRTSFPLTAPIDESVDL